MGIGISEAVELTGRVAELVKKGATLEAQERIAELREAVLNGKDEVLRLREDNQQLRQKLQEQEGWDKRAAQYQLVKAIGGAMVYRFSGNPEHYACPACMEAKRVNVLQDKQVLTGAYQCPGCKADYRVGPNNVPRGPINVIRG
jgi:hypothetical protein